MALVLPSKDPQMKLVTPEASSIKLGLKLTTNGPTLLKKKATGGSILPGPAKLFKTLLELKIIDRAVMKMSMSAALKSQSGWITTRWRVCTIGVLFVTAIR